MEINTPSFNNLKSLADVYDYFYDDYLRNIWGDKRVKMYDNILKTYGKWNLMRVFIVWYYKGLDKYTVVDNVKWLKWYDYIEKENWNKIGDLYKSFCLWLSNHHGASDRVKEFVYNDVRNKILSDDSENKVYKYAYKSWEEYLKDPKREKSFDAWKELSCAYFEKWLKRLWYTLPQVVYQTKSDIDGNYYSQKLKECPHFSKRGIFLAAMNRVLDENNITGKEIGKNKYWETIVIWNMYKARDKIQAILSAYSNWKKLFDEETKEERELFLALVKERKDRAKEKATGFKPVLLHDWTPERVVGWNYVDEDWEVQPYLWDENN